MTTKIKCIAIDDEPLALDQIKRFLTHIPDLEVIGTFHSTSKARETIDRGSVDVIFLDIDMPDCNGIKFARSLRPSGPIIVFTTAYPQFAVEGFRLDAVDYLLKPLSFEDLSNTIKRIKRRLTSSTNNNTSPDKHIFIKDKGTVRKIAPQDIVYIKGLNEYVQIKIKNEPRLVTIYGSIKNFETQLANAGFMRIHKSYLINLQLITTASRTRIKTDGEEIPVGETYRARFLRYLKEKLHES